MCVCHAFFGFFCHFSHSKTNNKKDKKKTYLQQHKERSNQKTVCLHFFFHLLLLSISLLAAMNVVCLHCSLPGWCDGGYASPGASSAFAVFSIFFLTWFGLCVFVCVAIAAAAFSGNETCRRTSMYGYALAFKWRFFWWMFFFLCRGGCRLDRKGLARCRVCALNYHTSEVLDICVWGPPYLS